jgi:2,6-dihydroxypseudooxynicotine hydrolase
MTDQRLEDAIGHWAPRFVANGIDLNDYNKLAQSIERWSDWCGAWCEIGAVHEELGRQALDLGRTRSAGQHLAQAAVYYHFAKFMFVQDMAQLRAAHARAVRCLDDALPHLDPPGERVEIPFEGSKMVGVLRVPPGEGPHPAVVLIAGLDSAKEELRPTEQLFLDRGLATFTLDGPGQGEAEYDLPIRPDWEIPGAAVIDVVEARPEIDGERIGVWGVSLGGYYAPRVASGDKRVRACVLCRGRSRSARSGTSSPRSRGRRSRRGLDHQATKRPATARSN